MKKKAHDLFSWANIIEYYRLNPILQVVVQDDFLYFSCYSLIFMISDACFFFSLTRSAYIWVVLTFLWVSILLTV